MANIASHLFRQAQIRASKTALIFGARTFTFAQIHSQVCRVASGLSAAGFKAGDKLAIMLAAGPEFIAFEYAAFALGGVVVPLNVHYKSGELEYALRSCEVDSLIIQNEFASLLSDAALGRLACLRHVWILGGQLIEPGTSRVASAEPLVEFPESIVAVTERGGDDLALMLHTSATTGKAKGVMLTVAQSAKQLRCDSRMAGPFGCRPNLMCVASLQYLRSQPMHQRDHGDGRDHGAVGALRRLGVPGRHTDQPLHIFPGGTDHVAEAAQRSKGRRFRYHVHAPASGRSRARPGTSAGIGLSNHGCTDRGHDGIRTDRGVCVWSLSSMSPWTPREIYVGRNRWDKCCPVCK